MEKLGAASVPDLVRLADELESEGGSRNS